MIAVRRARRLLHRYFFVFHNSLGKIKASGVEEATPVAIYYSFCEGRIVPTHRRDAEENQRRPSLRFGAPRTHGVPSGDLEGENLNGVQIWDPKSSR